MTYHKGMHSKAMGLLTGVGMIGMGKNKQFSYPYPYPHLPVPTPVQVTQTCALAYMSVLHLLTPQLFPPSLALTEVSYYCSYLS